MICKSPKANEMERIYQKDIKPLYIELTSMINNMPSYEDFMNAQEKLTALEQLEKSLLPDDFRYYFFQWTTNLQIKNPQYLPYDREIYYRAFLEHQTDFILRLARIKDEVEIQYTRTLPAGASSNRLFNDNGPLKSNYGSAYEEIYTRILTPLFTDAQQEIYAIAAKRLNLTKATLLFRLTHILLSVTPVDYAKSEMRTFFKLTDSLRLPLQFSKKDAIVLENALLATQLELEQSISNSIRRHTEELKHPKEDEQGRPRLMGRLR